MSAPKDWTHQCSKSKQYFRWDGELFHIWGENSWVVPWKVVRRSDLLRLRSDIEREDLLKELLGLALPFIKDPDLLERIAAVKLSVKKYYVEVETFYNKESLQNELEIALSAVDSEFSINVLQIEEANS